MTANDDVNNFVATITTPITVLSRSGVYVSSATCNDDFGGATAEHPFRTIKQALRLVRQENAATVHLAEATYTEYGFEIAGPITIVSDGDRTNVIMQAQGTAPGYVNTTSSDKRVFKLSHSDAVITNLTVRNGTAGTTAGGNVSMSDGLVVDCVISAGACAKETGNLGCNLCMTDGRVSQCRIEKGRTCGYKNYGLCARVNMSRGVLENSLIAGSACATASSISDTRKSVVISRGTLVNCTVAGNEVSNCET